MHLVCGFAILGQRILPRLIVLFVTHVQLINVAVSYKFAKLEVVAVPIKSPIIEEVNVF